MSASRAGIPLALTVPAYLTGVAVGTLIAAAWNSGDDARGLVRLAARTLHRPPRDVRARMAVASVRRPTAGTRESPRGVSFSRSASLSR